jgi:hypothetical protein
MVAAAPITGSSPKASPPSLEASASLVEALPPASSLAPRPVPFSLPPPSHLQELKDELREGLEDEGVAQGNLYNRVLQVRQLVEDSKCYESGHRHTGTCRDHYDFLTRLEALARYIYTQAH